LRQQLVPGQLVHGIVTDGGQASNVIPGRAAMQYTMRAGDRASLRALEDRMADCFRAGAIATGCEYQINESAPAYDELRPDPWLSAVFRAEMVRCGRNPVSEDLEAALPLGSTDMGNITHVMAGIHPVVGIDSGGASIHQPGFAAAAVGASADEAVIDGAIMLARTVIQLAQTPAERDRVLQARADRAPR
jgi:metal-dependent amidase/aminoacylase/carboxypeptidase family protein